jgi:hypothetical protein
LHLVCLTQKYIGGGTFKFDLRPRNFSAHGGVGSYATTCVDFGIACHDTGLVDAWEER